MIDEAKLLEYLTKCQEDIREEYRKWHPRARLQGFALGEVAAFEQVKVWIADNSK